MPADLPTQMMGLVAFQQVEPGIYKPVPLETVGTALRVTKIGGLVDGYEVAEVANVSNVRGTLVFSGITSARMWLRDEGASVIGRIYYVINAADADEADARLAAPGARMILRMGETVDVPFDADEGVVRVDYIANVAETGANLLYIEGRK